MTRDAEARDQPRHIGARSLFGDHEARLSVESEVCTEVYMRRVSVAMLTHPNRAVKPNPNSG